MKRLTIISHTEHYTLPDGGIVGLGSTVTEINQLLALFDHITHIAPLHRSAAPPSALPYSTERIQFVPIPAVGGPKLSDKVAILSAAPRILRTIHTHLKTSDYFQFRAPTGMGVFVIPYLMAFAKTKGWFKYAGNWKQPNPPLAYRFQKWLLTTQYRKVTMNGHWEDQPSHCLSFENPCLTAEDIEKGTRVRLHKSFGPPFHFCFVGRLEAAKGLDLLLEAFAVLAPSQRSQIGTIHIVGNGKALLGYKERVAKSDLHVVFHGWLSRSELQNIYSASHALLLPSASEGFPKVIAEAMNFGCVPIVSNVSSIGQYITHGQQGFLLPALTVEALQDLMSQFLELPSIRYQQMIALDAKALALFSYERYTQRLKETIL